MHALSLVAVAALFPLTAQAGSSAESSLPGTRVTLEQRADSLVNHAHAILRSGRLPVQNVIDLEADVQQWGFEGTAHEALLDLMAPTGTVPTYFAHNLLSNESPYGYTHATGALLVTVGKAQFGEGATITAFADPSYRFASIDLSSVTLGGQPIEVRKDMSALEDFYGVSAQKWGLEQSGVSGELALTFEITWITEHRTVSLPIASGATVTAGQWQATIERTSTDDEGSTSIDMDFEPSRAIGFYVTDRGMSYQGRGSSTTSASLSYAGAPAKGTEIVMSFPEKTKRETVTVRFDVAIAAAD